MEQAQIVNKKRQSFILEEETIEVKPSTELIPDEYLRSDNNRVMVEVICRKEDECAIDLKDELQNLNYLVNATDISKQNIDELWLRDFIANVNKKIEENKYEGLLMIFAKVQFSINILKTIWGHFTTDRCPALKNRPKMFIFQISKTGLETDFLPKVDLKIAYDTPSEADILIVYDKFEQDSPRDFLEEFYTNIKTYGHQEHIVTLVSVSPGSKSSPLTISTMTKNLFFPLHHYRGHHYNINKHHLEIKENLKKVKDFAENVTDRVTKEGEKGTFSKYKKTFSFARKGQNGKNSENKKSSESEEEAKSQTVDQIKKDEPDTGLSKKSTRRNKPRVKPIKISPAKPPSRKTSNFSVPETPIKKTSSRPTSSNFSSKEDVSKKPPWR